jgi:release factor glutamine methyltransferase
MLEQAAFEANGAVPGETAGEAMRLAAASFRMAGLETASLDARLLVSEACALTPEAAITQRNLPLTEENKQRICHFVNRRLTGEPVSRILGRRDFWGLTFELSPHTLDPRPETELLVETALDYVKSKGLTHAPLRILDLGTGAGCLLGALLSELREARGIGADISPGALAAARRNLARLGLLDRAAFLCGDWGTSIQSAAFDIIVCNPPYIAPVEIGSLEREVREFDPYIALDGGFDGLEAYRALAPQALRLLRKGGFVIFETGKGQAQDVRGILSGSGNEAILETEILTDLAGVERAVAGVRQSKRHKP